MSSEVHADVAPVATATEQKQARRLLVVLVVIALFFVFELMGAKAAQSDVLEADAFHLLMDVFALGISLGAMRIASARPNARFTFGLRRAESLAALVNGALVIGVCIELVRDAFEDLGSHRVPKSGLMLIVASAALVVNGLSAWLLHGVMGLHGHGHAHGHDHGHGHGHGHGSAHKHDHAHDHAHDHHDHGHAHGEHDHACKDDGHDHVHHDHGHDHAHDAHAHGHADDDEGEHPAAHAHHLNLRGAWLHLMGDALGSLAAFAAGLAIRMGAPPIVDPLASFLVVAILLVGAYRLLRDAGYVLLEAAPPQLPVNRIRKVILAHPGVLGVHALHVWSLGTGHDAVMVHVTADGTDTALGTRLGDILRTRFQVEYVTVQVDAQPRN
ncbi:Cobalt-zinc-cadmium resistance protein CzcD [Labilithrix luteola]|uniref:Cobalt-zinc-cadmium resistance protein CzcD n=1 Tax=Labilithrix luteola TaxID=1391654 RepID=A0A0K1QFP6_9BACT|nr:cation diffusion facilitator family transporter [Labilithrix luteola]AKV04235.1 Cobalt-zinc-cadmium resistance protein CzcD [Labilithrix luteola]